MIGWFDVDLKLRGEAIGKHLLEKVESVLKRFGYLDLRIEPVSEFTPVYEPYTVALKFYESAAFEVEKRGRLRNDMGYKWRHSTLRKKLASR